MSGRVLKTGGLALLLLLVLVVAWLSRAGPPPPAAVATLPKAAGPPAYHEPTPVPSLPPRQPTPPLTPQPATAPAVPSARSTHGLVPDDHLLKQADEDVVLTEPWDLDWDRLPPRLKPPEFERLVRAAFADCNPENVELHGVDCSEPPCYAVLGVRRDRMPEHTTEDTFLRAALAACPAWREPFGSDVTRYIRHNANKFCQDGHEEWVTLIGSSASLPALGADTTERLEYVKDRGEERRDEAYTTWVCGR